MPEGGLFPLCSLLAPRSGVQAPSGPQTGGRGDAVTPGYHLATLRVASSRRSWLEVVVLTRCARSLRLLL